jgi:putative endonuclease
MTSFKQHIGQREENDALKYLTKKGMKLIEKNFSCKLGEIDLVMQDRDQLVFVEVRYRQRSVHGNAADSITPAKIQKIIRTATLYLQRKNILNKVSGRFDVVAIDATGSQKQITWYKNAFSA